MEKQYCIATIDQGPNKGKQCTRKQLVDTKYCGKHNNRYNLIETAKRKNKRICDNGKRACKNYTHDNKLLCEICLEKCRNYDNKLYSERKLIENICITCGVHIESLIIGENEKEIKRCQPCYTKMKEIETRRVREERNYNEERKRNIQKHYTEYKKGSSVRNIWFELTLDEFKVLVEQPCFYCNTYNNNEVIGIDRLYSDLGYSIKNCVTACKLCNMMKNDLDPMLFVEHIQKVSNNKIELYEKMKLKLPSESECEKLKQMHKSYIRPNEIINCIKKGKLDEYIQHCIQEGRDKHYIIKIQELKYIESESRIKLRDAIHRLLKYKTSI